MSESKMPPRLRLVSLSHATEPEGKRESRPADDKPFVLDPGQNLRIEVEFEGVPEAIRFSYLAPGETVAVHEKFGDANAKIKNPSPCVYRRRIDTRGMRSGEGWWYIAGDDDANDGERQSAKLGRFTIRECPPTLISPEAPVVPVRLQVVTPATVRGARAVSRAANALDMLGGVVAAPAAPAPRWIRWALGGLAGAVVAGVAAGVTVVAISAPTTTQPRKR